jgi:hypothetical protein
VLAIPVPSKTEELILAITRAARVGLRATPELRKAIHGYVRGLKASGYRPEEVLVAVKALIIEAGVEKRSASPGSPAAELTDRVVGWSIDAYFASTTDEDKGETTKDQGEPRP